MPRLIAHIIDFGSSDPVALVPIALAVTVVALVVGLVIEHHVVKHGRFVWAHFRRGLAVVLALGLAAVIAPASAQGQDRAIPIGLPDLASEPPLIWFEQNVNNDDGSQIKVLSFDGYVYNTGEGMLDLLGNPQEPDGMRQRYFDGEEWIDVGGPRVIYETTDDHNHFHLMAAASYELWDVGRTTKVSDAAKVGFCLLDSVDRDNRYESTYGIDDYDYCGSEKPDTTELRMGISPGWTDLYDANTTLQWVDVSEVRPGWYWVGSIIDPEDQIVESNEDNNGLVFSSNRFAVTGYEARPIPVQIAGEAIQLKANVYGHVGDVVWSIVQGPENGTLSVPVGVDLFDDTVVFTPNDDFDGVDSFTYTARSLQSRYPLQPLEVTVQVDAGDYEQTDEAPQSFPDPEDPVELDAIVATEFEPFELAAPGDEEELDESTRWYSTGLPPGLSIDAMTGVISGVPEFAPSSQATITAFGSDRSRSFTLPWSTETQTVSLQAIGNVTSPLGAPTSRFVGVVDERETSYEATGLPPGLNIVPNVPLLAGESEEAGTFQVELREIVDGDVTRTSAFTWTVLPSAVPRFAN